MANANTDRSNLQHFTLYLANRRIYARNPDGHLVDLGGLRQEDGRFGYVLDGDKSGADGLDGEDAVLRRLEDELTFVFLDGQFTSLPDVSDQVDVEGAPQRRIALEEFVEDGDDPAA
ncbi:hypothetical protein [Coralloluteibacterium stylophorae]|uniref:Uncharacterized protein n=1 Tax=Coralloluteibacterium stylophorae TaxID=1776034 RepID=A0A8J8AXQ8_9GAMM|nr:hypothetical protein [Coralloluteibacterium stylophorae]MBS7455746.1 hypothetical protein [Coralloluteibacterium stylophorae]